MTDRTAAPRQSQPTRAIVERFRRYDDDTNKTLAFEQSSDLMLAVQAIDDHVNVDLAEAQVLIRQNIDGEGITIVYVDDAHGPNDDQNVLCEAIAALQEVQRLLAQMQAGQS